MKSAVLGLVLLFSSWIIIQKINPEIIPAELRAPKLVSLPGVVIIVFPEELAEEPYTIPCPNYSPNSAEFPEGASIIQVEDCPGEKRTFILYAYPEPNLGGKPIIKEISCGDMEGLPTSFEIREKEPGVYVFEGDCDGYRERFTSSQEDLGRFDGNVGCIEIVNKIDKAHPENNVYYGAILHEFNMFLGRCRASGEAIQTIGKITSLPIDLKGNKNFSSLTVFHPNHDWEESKEMDPVVFFSDPHQKGGYFEFSWENRSEWVHTSAKNLYEIGAKEMIFSYPPNTSNAEKDKCDDWTYWDTEIKGLPWYQWFNPWAELGEDIVRIKPEPEKRKSTFRVCSGSIRILGDYLVLLEASPDIDKDNPVYPVGEAALANYQCQAFTKEQSSLYTPFQQLRGASPDNIIDSWITEQGRVVWRVTIVPLQ